MVVFGFYFLPVIMVGSVLYMIRQSSGDQATKKKTSTAFLVWLVLWIVYVSAIVQTGLIQNFDLPPRVPLLLVFPALLSIFLFVRWKTMQQVIAGSSKLFPVYIQSFRVLVELLIYGAFLKGVLPQAVTFEGTNFDILVGISALFAGLMFAKNILSEKGLVIWNIVSLSVLAVTVFTFVNSFYFSGSIDDGLRRFGGQPYVQLPAILLPCAIFYHAVSIMQLVKKG